MTLCRTFTKSLDIDAAEQTRHAVADTRSEVLARSSAAGGDNPVILDLDASLIEIHSEHKAGTAALFEGGFGCQPVLTRPLNRTRRLDYREP